MSNKKYNFQYHSYTKRGYLSFQTKMVDNLLNEGKFNLAKNMLKEGINIKTIIRITELTEEEISNL